MNLKIKVIIIMPLLSLIYKGLLSENKGKLKECFLRFYVLMMVGSLHTWTNDFTPFVTMIERENVEKIVNKITLLCFDEYKEGLSNIDVI